MYKKVVYTFGEWVPTEDGKGWLLDYVWEPREKRALLAFRTPQGEVGLTDEVRANGAVHRPMAMTPDGAAVVRFPDGLGELRHTASLLNEVVGYLRRHVYLEDAEGYERVAMWVLMTWFYDGLDSVSYLGLRGRKEDKRMLDEAARVVGSICYRPVAEKRVGELKAWLDCCGGTGVIGYLGDTLTLPKFSEAAILLNTGAMRGVAKMWNIQRTEERIRVSVFDVYGPKLIAVHEDFAFDDPATEGRVLYATCDGVDDSGTLGEEVGMLQRALLRWRLEHWQPSVSWEELPGVPRREAIVRGVLSWVYRQEGFDDETWRLAALQA